MKFRQCSLREREAGFNQVIGFDMGGTSTDVSHFAGEYERSYGYEFSGIHIRTPMMIMRLYP